MTGRFTVFAGPCLIESREMIFEVAERLAQLSRSTEIDLFLKGSFVKANRTSIDSPTTIGPGRALALLAEAGAAFGLRTITDVHSVEDVRMAAAWVDILQIPAFLCRQTELLVAAGETGRGVNIKKGQFVAPEDMVYAVEKVRRGGAEEIYVCERGTTFGYHDLVVDMRGLVRMRSIGVPVIFDATHSTQQPSIAGVSGGDRSLSFPLARAAAAVGIDGLFFETHPEPSEALSDSATQIPLEEAGRMVREVLAHHELQQNLSLIDRESAGE